MVKTTKKVAWSFGLASTVGMLLFAVGALRNGSLDYWYLPYNLVLALIPLALAVWLGRLLQRRKWYDWPLLILACFWLLLLPNSFYIVTDFIHLPETHRVDMVQDIVMLFHFSVLGLVAGFFSLFTLHRAYLRQLSSKIVTLGVALALLLSSFAIYIGRELRWNSWDIIVNPLPLLSDVLATLLNPDAWFMALSFFGMMASLYVLFWYRLKATSLDNKY